MKKKVEKINSRTVKSYLHQDDADSIIKAVLMGNINAKQCNKYGDTLLHSAIRAGAKEVALRLVELRSGPVDVNARGASKRTPLMLAVLMEEDEVAHRLMDLDECDVNAVDEEGASALHLTVEPEIIERLLDRTINVVATKSGIYPADVYVRGNSTDSLRVLLQRNCAHTMSTSVLHCAVDYGSPDCAELILEESGTEYVSLKDERGLTPFLLACFLGDIEMVELLGRTAKVDEVDANGKSACEIALVEGRDDIIPILKKFGMVPEERILQEDETENITDDEEESVIVDHVEVQEEKREEKKMKEEEKEEESSPVKKLSTSGKYFLFFFYFAVAIFAFSWKLLR